jgi:hypothetical protein
MPGIGGDMHKNWGEVTMVDPDKLYKLFQIIDDIGVYHEWSEEYGELSIKAEDVWITFTTAPGDKADDNAYADAQRVADMYWRQ